MISLCTPNSTTVPMDVKPCQTLIQQQQLLLQQQQQQQQQLLHCNTLMSLNGNEGMLTTSTANIPVTTTTITTPSQLHSTHIPLLSASVSTTTPPGHVVIVNDNCNSGSVGRCAVNGMSGHQETLSGNDNSSNKTNQTHCVQTPIPMVMTMSMDTKNHHSTFIDQGMVTTPIATAAVPTLVNGNCNSHNGSHHGNDGNNTNDNKITTQPCGPGPPALQAISTSSNSATNYGLSMQMPQQQQQQQQHQQALNALACSANQRITLGECRLNSNSNSNISINNNNNIYEHQHHAQHPHHQHQHHHQHHHHHHQHQHHPSSIEAALALQQHLLQHQTQQLNNHPALQHQQQQQQQQTANNCSNDTISPNNNTLHSTVVTSSATATTTAAAALLSSSLTTAIAPTTTTITTTTISTTIFNNTCSSSIALSVSVPSCGYCCRPICDRYIMRVVDTSFHESCLKCATCSLHLVHSCFARNGKLYCRLDYERQFMRNRCLGCGCKIAADELVMRTLDENVFHLKCFACVVCGAILKKGEQYVVKQGQLFCRFDYEKEVEMLQGYDFYGDDLFAPKLDGRRGPKRPRTILNTQQRRAFKASFEVSPKPCRKVRENLAKETGLSLRIVQVWFQNQRAKVKKIQKKAKQEGHSSNSKNNSKNACDSQDSQESDSSNVAKIKDETHSDTESLIDSPYSSSNGTLDKHLRHSLKDENENASFNCMETNKENCHKANEPVLNTILGLSYATFQQLMGPFTHTPMINPIDRLYSMQNAYFRSEELPYSDNNGTHSINKDLVES